MPGTDLEVPISPYANQLAVTFQAGKHTVTAVHDLAFMKTLRYLPSGQQGFMHGHFTPDGFFTDQAPNMLVFPRGIVPKAEFLLKDLALQEVSRYP